MTIQSELVTLLNSITPGKVFPDGGRDNPTAPYITLTRVSVLEEYSLSGPNALTNTRMQISVWAKSNGDAVAKATAIKSAMAGWTHRNVKVSEVDFYEPETKLFRVALDFSIWHY